MSNYQETKTPREHLSLACGIISLCGVIRPNLMTTSYNKHEMYFCPVDIVSFGNQHTKGKFSKFVFPHGMTNIMFVEVSQAKWKHIDELTEYFKGMAPDSVVIRDGIKKGHYHRVFTFRGDRVKILKRIATMYEFLA